jgi:glycosyltransferase involved in cell wall biosynthesis
MVTVSIITPAYNADRFIDDAYRSLLHQNFWDWEWIVIDDGSTDATTHKIAALQDDRILYIRQENRGVSAARNLALDSAKGRFVTFLDADDRLPESSLSRRVAFLDEHRKVDVLNGAILKFGHGLGGERYCASTNICGFFPRISQLDEGVFFGPFYMIRRNAICDHRFPEGVTHCEDLIFFTELAHERDLVYAGLDTTVYEYRVSASSAMSNMEGIEAGYLEYLSRVLPLEKMTPKMRSYLRKHVASILAKSWLRKGCPLRAVTAASKALHV